MSFRADSPSINGLSHLLPLPRNDEGGVEMGLIFFREKEFSSTQSLVYPALLLAKLWIDVAFKVILEPLIDRLGACAGVVGSVMFR